VIDVEELEVGERLLRKQREEYLKTRGWTWYWKKPEEPPKPEPRKLFKDERLQMLRPTVRIER